MAQTIQIKRSDTTTNVPGSLAAGELAINRIDGLLFWTDELDAIQSTDLVNPGSGTFLPLTGGTLTGALTVQGNLDVQGTTTTIDTATLIVEDKNIEMGNVTTPTDVTADGGGITLLGDTNKTIIWDDANNNWTSNQNWNLETGLDFKINNVSVLNATALGSSVVGSSLTSVGTIATGTWEGTIVDTAHGGTGADLSAEATGTIFKLSAGDVLEAAVAGTDYSTPTTTIDGGTF